MWLYYRLEFIEVKKCMRVFTISNFITIEFENAINILQTYKEIPACICTLVPFLFSTFQNRQNIFISTMKVEHAMHSIFSYPHHKALEKDLRAHVQAKIRVGSHTILSS